MNRGRLHGFNINPSGPVVKFKLILLVLSYNTNKISLRIICAIYLITKSAKMIINDIWLIRRLGGITAIAVNRGWVTEN